MFWFRCASPGKSAASCLGKAACLGDSLRCPGDSPNNCSELQLPAAWDRARYPEQFIGFPLDGSQGSPTPNPNNSRAARQKKTPSSKARGQYTPINGNLWGFPHRITAHTVLYGDYSASSLSLAISTTSLDAGVTSFILRSAILENSASFSRTSSRPMMLTSSCMT